MKISPLLMFLTLAPLLLSACDSEKVEVLKSPCAGIDGSPCGPKRPMNGDLNPGAANPLPQVG